MERDVAERLQTRRGIARGVGAGLAVEEGQSSRFLEAVPGIVSWIAVLAPIWVTLINPQLGILLVTAVTAYFGLRVSSFGLRALLNRPRVLAAMHTDWLARLEELESQEWRRYRVTLLIRAFREGNREMLRQTIDSIYASNWPRNGTEMARVEVVFATEKDDPITPPLVDDLAREYEGRVRIRQIRHPRIPGHLPGPSSAMHYAGKVLYEEALREGFPPQRWLVADFDCDTVFHPQYLPALVYHYATDPMRHHHAYQPVVLFTTDYWRAPLHSRLAAMGTSVLTLGWNRRPEIAFTGAAASLALLRSVDFWPTNSHSQDSGVELRFRMRYGPDFRVVGIPVPLRVYPVMVVGEHSTLSERLKAYVGSFRTLFRQSARWREGPLDEFVESATRRYPVLMVRKLLNGLERDTLTLMPGLGPLAAQFVVLHFRGGAVPQLPLESLVVVLAAVLSFVSLLGLVAFGQTLLTDDFLPPAPVWRRLGELPLFWLVMSVYVPIVTACAGLKTSTAYLLGQRPRGHFLPTPK